MGALIAGEDIGMAKKFSFIAFSLLLSAMVVPAAAAGSGSRGDYIIVLKDSAGDPAAVARDHRRDHGAEISHVYRYALKGYSASLPDQAVRAIQADRRVLAVNVDAPVQALGHTLGNLPTGVHRTFAADNANIDIDGSDDRRVDVDIAIIDTGIDIDHPDLDVVGGKNCQKGSSYDDGNGHGTHVAGSAAGLDNGNGAVGMAPGARLWAVRVLDNSGSGSWSSVICGVDWVTQNASTIEVANMSLGGSGTDPDNTIGSCTTGNGLHDAICRSVAAGTTYAVAAGNSSADSANHVPAAFDEVMTVSALADFDGIEGGLGSYTCRSDADDTFANFSNYGADVDLIAPGVCIRSSWKGGGYNTISGTSMASPHVAGAAALYKATNPAASPAQVQTKLQERGNAGWNNADDKDATKEPLLDVSDTTDFAPAMGDNGGGTPPPPPADAALTVGVAKVGETTRSGPWYRADLKVTVTDGTAPVGGAAVTLEVRATECSGASQGSTSGTTGTDGTVTFSFRSRTPGSYCAIAAATKSGYTAGTSSGTVFQL